MTCDASNYGIGAILSHRYTDNSERPICFASRTLSTAEKNYAIPSTNKVALAIIYGVKKFYQYLIGKKFVLRTDHKPLITLFNQNKGIPLMAAGRIQRWALYLSGFDFYIQYVSSSKNLSVTLSRLLIVVEDDSIDDVNILLFISDHLLVKSVTYESIKAETRKDKELALIMAAVKNNSIKSFKSTNFNVQPFTMEQMSYL